jgi:hypothetical protein
MKAVLEIIRPDRRLLCRNLVKILIRKGYRGKKACSNWLYPFSAMYM